MKDIGLILMAAGLLGLLLFGGFYFKILPLSLTGGQCSADGVSVRFEFKDEPDIPQCFIGSISCIGKSPSGKLVNLGGAMATASSTEKINCPPYTGKSFVGGYIPTDVQGGDYSVTCTGKDDSTNKTFTITRTIFTSCPTFNNKCVDGTPLNTCSQAKPYYCDKYGYLIQKPNVCGCPSGTVYIRDDGVCGNCPSGTYYDANGKTCMQVIVSDKCAGQPTSCPSGQHISKDSDGCNICVMNPIEDPYQGTNQTGAGGQTTTNPLSQFLHSLTNDQIKFSIGISGLLFLIGLYMYRR